MQIPHGAPPPPLRSARLLPEAGVDVRRVQELLGYSDVSTTMTYTHVLASSAAGLASPLDSLHCAERPAPCLH